MKTGFFPLERSLCTRRLDMGVSRSEHGYTLVDIMVVVAIIGIVAAAAVPMIGSGLSGFQFQGDGEGLANTVKLAKMRAAASFSRARVRANLAASTYQLEVWDRDGATWVLEGAPRPLTTSAFGFNGLAAPPPSTQAGIGLSPACLDDTGTAIASTACVLFNSRGIPVDGAGAPVGDNGLYITDGVTGVYGVTVTMTPLVRLWWSPANAAAGAAWQER